MRTICGIALVVLVGSLATAADADDATKIAGNWKVAACELESRLLPASAFQDLTYTLAADGAWRLDGGPGFPKAGRGRFVLNTQSSPRTIDFIPAEGPYQGKTFRGIYQLEGDELKACFAFPGKDRPKTYLTHPDSGLVLEFWRRSPRK